MIVSQERNRLITRINTIKVDIDILVKKKASCKADITKLEQTKKLLKEAKLEEEFRYHSAESSSATRVIRFNLKKLRDSPPHLRKDYLLTIPSLGS